MSFTIGFDLDMTLIDPRPGMVLAMNRLSEEQLVARLRHDIPRSDLLQAITVGIGTPRSVVDALYRYRNEKRLADIVAFPAASVTDIGQPSEADLSKFYDSHPDLFRAPEYRGFAIASLSPGDLEQPGDITEDELRKEYDQRKDEFETPDRREIQQILAPSEEKAKEAEAALAAGKDWKEVATTIAEQDPETIELGPLSRQEIPHELGDVAFELALNQPSQPIKTPLGWHILRVVKIEPAATRRKASARDRRSTAFGGRHRDPAGSASATRRSIALSTAGGAPGSVRQPADEGHLLARKARRRSRTHPRGGRSARPDLQRNCGGLVRAPGGSRIRPPQVGEAPPAAEAASEAVGLIESD